MVLDNKDYKKIAEQIYEEENYVEYEKDGETIFIDCTLNVEGYREDDYFNGTGAFIPTSADFVINSVESYDDDGESTENDFDASTLEDIVKKQAMAI